MTISRPRIVLLGLIVLVICVGVTYAWHSVSRSKRWERGYDEIKEGDSEEKVLEILGKPTEDNDCDRLRYSRPEIWPQCADEYRYIGFMQEWGYVIGKNKTVLLKWHSVSP